jgi:hypothetical protein
MLTLHMSIHTSILPMTIPHPAEVGVDVEEVGVGVVVVGRLYKMTKWERSHYKENVYQKTPTVLCTSSYF